MEVISKRKQFSCENYISIGSDYKIEDFADMASKLNISFLIFDDFSISDKKKFLQLLEKENHKFLSLQDVYKELNKKVFSFDDITKQIKMSYLEKENPIIIGSRMPSVEFIELEIAIIGDVRRGRVDNEICIHIANPNTVTVGIEEIEMSLLNVICGVPSQIQGGGATAKIDGNINAESITDRKIELNGRLKIDFLGDIVVQEFILTVETSGAAVASKSFEEEFEV